MIFIETPIFTRQITGLVDDETYRQLQRDLIENPDSGDVILGAGGLRKIRIAAKGKGKRGGARVIYFHFLSKSRIAMLLVYPKNEKDDLTESEKKILVKIIKTWRHE